jgi:hypothetical protein
MENIIKEKKSIIRKNGNINLLRKRRRIENYDNLIL